MTRVAVHASLAISFLAVIGAAAHPAPEPAEPAPIHFVTGDGFDVYDMTGLATREQIEAVTDAVIRLSPDPSLARREVHAALVSLTLERDAPPYDMPNGRWDPREGVYEMHRGPEGWPGLHSIRVHVEVPCLGATALAHELAHLLLSLRSHDSQPDHHEQAWWGHEGIVAKASAAAMDTCKAAPR